MRSAGKLGCARWVPVTSWRFMMAESRRLASALGSLLRFWHLQGLIGEPLDQMVPRVPNRRSGLSRPLELGQVRALLASCDRDTAAGRRDLATET
jgi:hypothetical protein